MYALIGLFVSSAIVIAWFSTWKDHVLPGLTRSDPQDPFLHAMAMVVLVVGMLFGVILGMTLWPFVLVGGLCLLLVRHYLRAREGV